MNSDSLAYPKILKGLLDERLCMSLKEQGYFYLSHLPLSHTFLDKLIAYSKAFFSLSQDCKESIHIKHSNIYRGYTPLGYEKTNGKPDMKETLDFGPGFPPSQKPLHGPNQWPVNPPGFSLHLQHYYQVLNDIGINLLRAIARGFGIAEHYFEAQFIGKPFSLLRVLSYPPTPNNAFGIGPHCDYGCLNLLYSDSQSALEFQDAAGDWQQISPRPHEIIVNSGDMLSYWLNGEVRSMPHRVIHRGNKNRISIPFFFEPGFDTRVRPLNAQGHEIHYGSHLMKAFQRSFNTTI